MDSEESLGIHHTQKMHHWMKRECPDELDPAEDREYNMKVQSTSSNQIDMEIMEAGQDDFGMILFTEINKGVPCVHISNQPDDNVIHVYCHREGVVVQRESSRSSISTFEDLPDAVIYENQVTEEE